MKLLLFVLCSLLFILPASAAVVYSGLVNDPVPLSMNGVYLNPFSGITPAEPTGPWINPFMGGVFIGSNDLLFPAITGADQILNLTGGTLIDSSLTYTIGFSGSSTHTTGSVTPNKFTLGVPGFLGFTFKPTVSGSTYYGWAQVVFSNTGPGSIIDWAYDDTAGTGIAAGFTGSVVPEPSRAVLLMIGLISVLTRRRR